MGQSRFDRAQSFAQIATGIGILAFWGLFFTVGIAPANPPPCYFAYEHAFPLPDLLLAVGLIAGAVNVLTRRSWGRDVSLFCGGGLLFLGLLDLSFNFQNGLFGGPIVEALQAGAVSAWCVAFGIWIVVAHATSRG
jgi:hypothetical protein